jgi:2-(1,2-epoxy-1,2-dihydrophenyl)acetyl-CoA isomerase
METILLVLASSDARFCEIFVRCGLTLDFGGSWLLPRLVGLQRAPAEAMKAFVERREPRFEGR